MVHGAAAHACVPSSLRSRCYFGRLRSIASATERGVGKPHFGVQARLLTPFPSRCILSVEALEQPNNY